jgi:flavin-binding protein dodecin
MVIKGIEVIGTSSKSASEATKNALSEVSETVRGIEWLRITDYSLNLKNNKISQHQVRIRVYFQVAK